MQQGISSAQMDEMQAEKVILVVPKAYHSAYPKEKNRVGLLLNPAGPSAGTGIAVFGPEHFGPAPHGQSTLAHAQGESQCG